MSIKKEDLMKPPLRWSEKDLNETPSIKGGISIEDERIERYIACQIVRDLIRDVFKTKENMRVQTLGCYYLQLFFMFQSMKDFDARHAVAFAAARLACKVFDEKPRGGGMYLELEKLRMKNGREGLSEDEKKDIRQQASEIEIFLLRLTNFHFDIALPCDEIDALVEKALVKLSCSETYKRLVGDKSPVQEAHNLKPQIVTSSKQFLTDAFMGLAPLRFSKRCTSLSAILFALRYSVRKIPMEELIKIVLVQDGDEDELDKKTLEDAFAAILNVFKIKGSAEKKVKEPQPWANVQSSPTASATKATTSIAPSPAMAPAVSTSQPVVGQASAPPVAAPPASQTHQAPASATTAKVSTQASTENACRDRPRSRSR